MKNEGLFMDFDESEKNETIVEKFCAADLAALTTPGFPHGELS